MSHSPAWEAAKATRRARRAADPAVQKRAAEHARKAAQQRQKATEGAA